MLKQSSVKQSCTVAVKKQRVCVCNVLVLASKAEFIPKDIN